MTTHKRGGSYDLQIMTDVTDWSGQLLDKRILDFIKVDDIVRVIIHIKDETYTRYINITRVLRNGYFKGQIYSAYNMKYCNGCNEVGEKKRFLYGCELDNCNFDCHMDCLKKQPDIKKCACILKKCPFQQGEDIIFKKNNISEVPNWSKNTERLIEQYKCDSGHPFTGIR
jgi:hypothetical protein